MGVITRVMTADPVCSLTFDDGPDPVWTPKVLEILREYRARATFFMVGEGAVIYPDIVERVARDGHAIGNHSWSHLAFPLIPLVEQWKQIRKCQSVIMPYGQRLFRPPYGMNNTKSNMLAFLQGFKTIGWSFSPEDWCEVSSKVIEKRIVKNIKAGSIFLLHDRLFDKGKPIKGPKNVREALIDREPMLFALNEVLRKLKGKIQFVTIPELLSRGRPQREKW